MCLQVIFHLCRKNSCSSWDVVWILSLHWKCFCAACADDRVGAKVYKVTCLLSCQNWAAPAAPCPCCHPKLPWNALVLQWECWTFTLLTPAFSVVIYRVYFAQKVSLKHWKSSTGSCGFEKDIVCSHGLHILLEFRYWLGWFQVRERGFHFPAWQPF